MYLAAEPRKLIYVFISFPKAIPDGFEIESQPSEEPIEGQDLQLDRKSVV